MSERLGEEFGWDVIRQCCSNRIANEFVHQFAGLWWDLTNTYETFRKIDRIRALAARDSYAYWRLIQHRIPRYTDFDMTVGSLFHHMLREAFLADTTWVTGGNNFGKFLQIKRDSEDLSTESLRLASALSMLAMHSQFPSEP